MVRAPIPWPEHWYQAQYQGHYDIKCIVPHCNFTTDANRMSQQWTQLHDHCASTPGAEHGLFKFMLRQGKCALCNHPPYYGKRDYVIRGLYEHSRADHNSDAMFHISSFVSLVRANRVLFSRGNHLGADPNCERLAFERMVGKVRAMPGAELRLLFEKGGVRDGEHTSSNLARILTYDPLVPRGYGEPYWIPLEPERFLAYCSPNEDEAVDGRWRRVWRRLREMYADGRI